MKIFNKNRYVIFLVIICFFLLSIWFKDHKYLATGEDSLILSNPNRAIELYKYAWIDTVSGQASPGFNARLPLLYIESYLLSFGLSIWEFQYLLFFLLMSAGAISCFFLTQKLLDFETDDKNKDKIGFISGFFYIFNPISMLTIWDRGMAVSSFIFFYSLAPLILFLFIKGVTNKQFFIIPLISIITVFFSTAFSSPAEPFLIFVLPFLYTIFLTIQKDSVYYLKIYPIFYFLLLFLLWILVSSWWIYPWISFSGVEYFGQSDINQFSLNTLKANSQDYSLDNILRLIHGGYLYRSHAYGEIYESFLFSLISWLVPFFMILGLLKMKKGLTKFYLAVALILFVYLAKGSSKPFSEIFIWMFLNIPPMQIFRNSFEKIGLVLPIIYAPLVSYGIFYISKLPKKTEYNNLIFVFLLFLLAIFHWPLLSGNIINFKNRDIRVEVPNAYKNSNSFIGEGNHVILSVPVMGGASGLYKWQYGFKGLEPGPYLFNYPLLSVINYADTVYGQVLIALSNGYTDDLISVAQYLSADIIAFRKDTDVNAFGYNLNAKERFEKIIARSNLQKIFDSEEISLWKMSEDNIVPVVYTPKSLVVINNTKELIAKINSKELDFRSEAFICIDIEKCFPNFKDTDLSIAKEYKIPEEIKLIKVNPSHYKINVKNSSGEFLLVFNNNFNKGWEVLDEGNNSMASKHILVNGYSNGFIINKSGSFELNLTFRPQVGLDLSYSISKYSFLAEVLLLLISLIYINRKTLFKIST